ncbi:hypothetical protein A3D78_02800 [Candidatus Gottesmanbacteria bacterium RIFCSPHIGHO2_02_FULL_39_14]|uniref:Glycosyltransferase RgtA/B/C/D-like domain-containing protein n=1 Tax=Candidatus Gottesmanbacteria bacterium RIFCSPHIGHO2_02_FULL_39_14 TaxID=1798383 RepID=A0A1F5ZZ49_9BACT|nr:MAG: hypothetical protein A3D78_02800 [Candidatus Gottesmanbacteria bacterium RIFCSPHIGHO2_02_FULL_39_14]
MVIYKEKLKRSFIFGLVIVGLAASFVYFSHQVTTVYGGDAGDFLASIAVSGIPHPPGYPLYTSLGILAAKYTSPGTLAFRVAYLSSIPSILALIFLYLLIFKVIGKVMASVIAVMTVAFSYPFFLYSSVVEVFALNNLFLVVIAYFSYLFSESGQRRYLFLAAFLFGLSLTHHQIVLFLVPGLFLLIAGKIKRISPKSRLKAGILLFLGLFPYLYVLVASGKNPPVNWMGPNSLVNFLKLILRSTYGTFTAGKFIESHIWSRLLNILALADFFYEDFTFWGILFSLLGFIYLYLNNKKIFRFSCTVIVLYIFFLFYASFPLTENFMLATFERFVLPVYLFLAIPMACGFIYLENFLRHFWGRMLGRDKGVRIAELTLMIFLVIPLSLAYKNSRKILILKNDRTAENFAYDILSSADKKSLLLIASDTPLFDSQYLYYSSKLFTNLTLIHFYKLYLPFYIEQLKRDVPELQIPRAIDTPESLEQFLEKNSQEFSIYSKQSFVLSRGTFLPWGLVYRYLPPNETENPAEVVRINEELWDKYHDPRTGSLSSYQHLYLSDILKLYGVAHLETANYELESGFYDLAIPHLRSSQQLIPQDPDSYLLLAQVHMKRKECTKASEEIDITLKEDNNNLIALFLRYQNYQSCFKDEKKAAEYFDAYLKTKKEQETPLEKL